MAATRLLIYGATGYTGRLIVEEMRGQGLRPILAGRSESKLAALRDRLGFETRRFDLAESQATETAVEGSDVVLNCAGPFSRTADPLIQACVRAGVHYIDVSGEVSALVAAAGHDAEARRRGVMVLPGVGFDVVPSDCLAMHVINRLPDATALHVAVGGLELLSRGSAQTMIDQLPDPVWVRRRGRLERAPPGSMRRMIDYGAGPRPSCAVSWGDVVTAYFSTGVPDITVYFESTPAVSFHTQMLRLFGWMVPLTPWQAWLERGLQFLPEGPTSEQRARHHAVVVAEAEAAGGRCVRARLRTPEAYTLTARSATCAAQRILRGDWEPGFQTPARLYGADFVLGLEGVTREDA